MNQIFLIIVLICFVSFPWSIRSQEKIESSHDEIKLTAPSYADPCSSLIINTDSCVLATNIDVTWFTNFPSDCEFGKSLVFLKTTLSELSNTLVLEIKGIGEEGIGQNTQVIVAQFSEDCDGPFTPYDWMCGLEQSPLEVTGLVGGEEYNILIGTSKDSEGEFELCLRDTSIDIVNFEESSQIEKWVNLYPNPAKNYLDLSISKDLNGDLSWKIYNQAGRLQMKGRLEATTHMLSTIDISTLSSGQFFMEIQTEKGLVTKKFTKQKTL